MWSQGFDSRIQATQIRSKGISFPFTAITLFLDAFNVHRCEIVFGRGQSPHWTVNLRCGQNGVPNSDLTICRVAGHAVPFVTHQAGSTKYAINLFLHTATPEAKHRDKGHVRVRMRIKIILPASFIQVFELLSRLGVHRVNDCLLIRKIGYRRAFECGLRCGFSPHEHVQSGLQRFIVTGHRTGLKHISCHRYKAVSCTGQVHFQSVFPVVHIIDSLVIRKVRRQLKKTAQACSRRGAFEIRIRENGDD